MNIYDIAKKANVSTATVSRVLNNSDKVREETKRHVLSVIEAEAYTPNIFARGLGLRSMRMVGLLCTDVADPFYARAVSLLERQLHAYGFNSILCSTGPHLDAKIHAMGVLLEKHVDAMILVGSAFQESTSNEHIRKASQKVPVLIVNGVIPLPGVYCVVCDEAAATQQATGQLLEAGCRRILFLYDTHTYSASQKQAGYQAALAQQGLAADPHLIACLPRDFDAIHKALAPLIGGSQFDAVMASDDFLAVGAQKALQSFGRSLPIIGFDNSVLAQAATPSLTSVDNRLDQLCRSAAEVLVQVLDGKQAPSCTTFAGVLVERQSFVTGSGEE